MAVVHSDSDVQTPTVGGVCGRQRRRSDSGAVGTALSASAFMVQAHDATAHVATTRRERTDRWARHGKRRLTGWSLMSVISELKFTPG
jgi:hypothetical protein